MATYEEFARTNTFEVEDIDRFKKTLTLYEIDDEIEIFAQHPDSPNKITLIMDTGTPVIDIDTLIETIDDPYKNIVELIADHLTKDSIAIIMASWSEGRRGCGGWAQSVNRAGEGVFIDTNDIQRQTEELFGMQPRSLSQPSR